MDYYIAKNGDRLDTVVYNHYGTLDVFEMVLSANSHLLERDLLLSRDKVNLPIFKIKQKTKDVTSLW